MKKKEKVDLSIEEASEFYGVSVIGLQKKIKEWKIPVSKSGKYQTEILDKYFTRNQSVDKVANVIAISNQKGGEGKTTISLFLSEALSFDSKVLLVDWDPQANATRLFVNEPERTVFDCLGYRKSQKFSVDTVIIPIRPNFHLLPSSLSLANLTTPFERDDFELLKDALLPVLSSYDFILIDCPPSLGLGLENALIAADYIIVPVQTRAFSVQGLKDLHETIQKIQNKANPRLKLLGAVFNQFEGNRALSGLSESVKKYFPVFKTSIYRKESIPQAQAKRKMLDGCDKETNKSFLDLAKEVRSKIHVKEK
ncbi:MAG TPA: AAA family ATPase [Leptospiraceae bacterium]|nr:AAA family ATPase [Leptospiraceae bacterium]HMW03839.1 AAA family ATPase [Leptospiraceae bacterium]HMX32888.1 AAA family ATPase [Leptospiraceae bacterium]HMY29819.1 AAA family ATPase [Leptospiraceae bacterium]HMZ65199.1 AAA family ATPase [Leptospiraceae bacterium]